MKQKNIISMDLGGSKLNIGVVRQGEVLRFTKHSFKDNGSKNQIFDFMVSCIEEQIDSSVSGIAVGVPSVVDVKDGIVYDVVNIPAWREVPLKRFLENIFKIPVYVNNDVNCFVVGEKYFGRARNFSDVVGVCLGAGMGVGLIINDLLHAGKNCGAGEFGAIAYEQGNLETYCSGYFFEHFHNITAKALCYKAKQNDPEALAIFSEFGRHVGKAISMIVLAIDPEAIIIGGAISKAYPFFIDSAKEVVSSLPFNKMVERIIIEQNDVENIALLGAAALYFDAVVQNENKPASLVLR